MLRSLLAFAFSFFAITTAVAADDVAAPTGVWVKEQDGNSIQFDFTKAKALIVTAKAGDRVLVLSCKSSFDKDGLIVATVEKVDNKNEFPADLKKGYEFKFKLKVDGTKAKLSDFAAENADAKNVVEGEYLKKEAK